MLRSSFCWTSAFSSCACFTMPSDISASPMRTSGILCWRSIASRSCSAVRICCVTSISPSFLWRSLSCTTTASSISICDARCSSISTSPIFGPISKSA
jgi:hypothetical protein